MTSTPDVQNDGQGSGAHQAKTPAKSKRLATLAIGTAAVILMTALITGLFYSGVFQSEEDRMEAVASDWVTAVTDGDLSTFEALSTERMLEEFFDGEGVSAEALEEFRQYFFSGEELTDAANESEVAEWTATGLDTITFTTTDINKAAQKLIEARGESATTASINNERNAITDMLGLGPSDIGFVIYKPQFSDSSGFGNTNPDKAVGVIMFDSRDAKNPLVAYAYIETA
jgi:hypothetical protein